MALRTTNLNLLPILQALLHQASVSRAAETLGLSQPATSNALTRLRRVLGDPLLVKVGRNMQLTPRAEQLRPTIDAVCDAIEALLLNTQFLPAVAKRHFVIATPDYLATLIGPPLLRRLLEIAPGVSIRFVDVATDFRQDLTAGRIDVAIIANVPAIVRDFTIQGGYWDRLVGVVAADHPFASTPPKTAAALNAYPLIGLDLNLQGAPLPHELMGLTAYGSGKPQLSASHLRVLPWVIAQTTGVAIMPEAFARQAARLLKIAYFDLPDPVAPLDICLVWSPVRDSEPAHRWFRDELNAIMQEYFQR